MGNMRYMPNCAGELGCCNGFMTYSEPYLGYLEICASEWPQHTVERVDDHLPRCPKMCWLFESSRDRASRSNRPFKLSDAEYDLSEVD